MKTKQNISLSDEYHVAVMLQEAVDALNINENGVYVDCTLGGGGHSREILSRLGEGGKLIVFDHDADAWKNKPKDKRVILVKENFKHLKRFLKYLQIGKVDGILADLGVSSFQFDERERGFSIRFDAPLDMRMDKRIEKTAADIIREYSEIELHKMFEKYGEVRNAKTLARKIAEERRFRDIKTIADLKYVIDDCIKGKPNRYLAQVFQAVRIELNKELEVLKDFLIQAPQCLNKRGRLAIITFHSLEDRIVKQMMKNGTCGEVAIDIFGKPIKEKELDMLKDMIPTEEEIKNNPRARSARLRIAEKI